MNWERILMDAIIAGIFGVIVALLSNIFIDLRGYKKIDSKIGALDNTTLSGQHKKIVGLINERHNSIKEVLSEKTGSILVKVENINTVLNKNEGRYESLNLDQKEIRNHVLKLVNNWEELIKENQELKQVVRELKKENDKLKARIKELEYEEERER